MVTLHELLYAFENSWSVHLCHLQLSNNKEILVSPGCKTIGHSEEVSFNRIRCLPYFFFKTRLIK